MISKITTLQFIVLGKCTAIYISLSVAETRQYGTQHDLFCPKENLKRELNQSLGVFL